MYEYGIVDDFGVTICGIAAQFYDLFRIVRGNLGFLMSTILLQLVDCGGCTASGSRSKVGFPSQVWRKWGFGMNALA